MNYTRLFHSLHPGFFQEESICALPRDWVFTELVMDLRKDLPNASPPCRLNGITFGEYRGGLAALQNAVRQVDEDWEQYFKEGCRFYCAFSGETIISFCNLADMGRLHNLHIGGPGCVGTIPEFRRQGIGLEMVRLATETLRQDGLISPGFTIRIWPTGTENSDISRFFGGTAAGFSRRRENRHAESCKNEWQNLQHG